MNNSLLKKFIEFGMGNFIVLITGFISSPIITRLVRPEELGKFSMFNTLTSLFLFIILCGLDHTYIRFFYEEKEESRGGLLIRAIKLPLLINLVLSLILLALYEPLSNLLIGNVSFMLIVVMVIHNTFNIINKFSMVVVRMQQKGKTYSFLQVLGRVSYILFILMSLSWFKNDYRILVFGTVVSNIVVSLIAVCIEKSYWFSFKKQEALNTSMKEMLKFGLPLVFSFSISWILQSTDKLFIESFNGYAELGVYTAAFTIVSLLNAVQESFVTFFTPVANEHYKQQPDNTTFFSQLNAIATVLMFFVGIGIIIFKDVFVMLLGESYREASYIFPFLIFMPMMLTISETTVIGINFHKQTKKHIKISIIAAVINVIGNFILVPRLGAKGAALSTGISYVVLYIARTYESKKLYEVQYHQASLFISLFFLTILAVYASFNPVNLTLIGLGTLTGIIVLFLYRKPIMEIIQGWRQKSYRPVKGVMR